MVPCTEKVATEEQDGYEYVQLLIYIRKKLDYKWVEKYEMKCVVEVDYIIYVL